MDIDMKHIVIVLIIAITFILLVAGTITGVLVHDNIEGHYKVSCVQSGKQVKFDANGNVSCVQP